MARANSGMRRVERRQLEVARPFQVRQRRRRGDWRRGFGRAFEQAIGVVPESRRRRAGQAVGAGSGAQQHGPAQVHRLGRADEEQSVCVEQVQSHLVVEAFPPRLRAPRAAQLRVAALNRHRFDLRIGVRPPLPVERRERAAAPLQPAGSLPAVDSDVHHRPRAALDLADLPQRDLVGEARKVDAVADQPARRPRPRCAAAGRTAPPSGTEYPP